MKSINNYVIFLIMLFSISSCEEKSFLEEKSLDFYSTENMYVTLPHFQMAVNSLYDQVRKMYWRGKEQRMRDGYYCSTDFAFIAPPWPDGVWNNYEAYVCPTENGVNSLWECLYKQIQNANAIIGRINMPNELSDDKKPFIKGQALFFRAFAYRHLANVYGGVPLVVEEVKVPRRDFVRASRDDVYNQCKIDLVEAISLLPDITEVKDGQISKQAAQHLLTEVYISLKMYPEAISTATNVINHNAMRLMTERFGSRKDELGDVYWDLFRTDNQNRSTYGNTESLWVLQYDWQNTSSPIATVRPRFWIPWYQAVKVVGKSAPSVVAFTDLTDTKCARGIGVYQPTSYFYYELWGDEFHNDIRNSVYNITRDFKIDNPEAEGFGEWLVADGWIRPADTIRRWYPFLMKVGPVGNFPDEAYKRDETGAILLTALGDRRMANYSEGYKDEYVFRLAETYLLRAEACLGNNEKDKAANDINVVRARANATPVDASAVDIDYILDERLRELYVEEIRNMTLMRVGKMVERVRKYNNVVNFRIGDHQNLLPIPFYEIEKNVYGNMEQNAGY